MQTSVTLVIRVASSTSKAKEDKQSKFLPMKITKLQYEIDLFTIRASCFIHLSFRKDVGKKAGKKLKGSSNADRI